MVVPDTLELPPRYEHAVRDSRTAFARCVAHPLRDNAGRVIGVLRCSGPRRASSTAPNSTCSTGWPSSRPRRWTGSARRCANTASPSTSRSTLLDLERGSTAAVVAAVYRPARVRRCGSAVTGIRSPRWTTRAGSRCRSATSCGHGLTAAIVMSRLRAAVAASALTAAEPAAVLGALDRYAASVGGARCATVAYALIDTEPDTGGPTISYSCAGHPYPLLVPPDRPPSSCSPAAAAGRRPPDVEGDPAKATATADLAPGSLILLYTDGLIERAGETLDDGFARLKSAAADAPTCRSNPSVTSCSTG